MSGRQSKSRERPKNRVLVRWSDDLDKTLLLSVQYACAEAGIKLPWQRVAEIMGPKFTEGAIVQHIAKMRVLMAGVGIPVPPPLKRGMITRTPSKIYANANIQYKFEPIEPLHPGTPKLSPTTKLEDEMPSRLLATPPFEQSGERATPKPRGQASRKAKSRAKGRGTESDDDDDDEEYLSDLGDTDEEDYAPARRTPMKSGGRATPRVRKIVCVKNNPSTPVGQAIKEEPDLLSSALEAASSGSVRRTRGIKRNYSVMANESSDNETDGDAVDEAVKDEIETDDEVDSDENTKESPTANAAADDDVSSTAETEVFNNGADGFEHGENCPGVIAAPKPKTVAKVEASNFKHPGASVTNMPYGQIMDPFLVPGTHGNGFPMTNNGYLMNFPTAHMTGAMSMPPGFGGGQYASGTVNPRMLHHVPPPQYSSTGSPSAATRRNSIATATTSQSDHGGSRTAAAQQIVGEDAMFTQSPGISGDIPSELPSAVMNWDELGLGGLYNGLADFLTDNL